MLRCSLSYAKIMQMSAMKTCFQIAECSLSYAKIMQMSAMKACFQIAECSLSYAKIIKIQGNKVILMFFNTKNASLTQFSVEKRDLSEGEYLQIALVR
ncbi:MAG TPA: hypothetical protein DEQ66_03665 [Prevotella sp.]|nr:hypothetical protein [Prevotella sp.]